jgi:hypothetical protein
MAIVACQGKASVRASEGVLADCHMTNNRFICDSRFLIAVICPPLSGLSLTFAAANIPDPVAQANKGLKKAAAPFYFKI